MKLTLGPTLDGDTPLTLEDCGLLPREDAFWFEAPDKSCFDSGTSGRVVAERKKADDTEGGTCD